MTAPIRPEPSYDRITRTIAAMRSQGATDDDIETYLTDHEGLKPEKATAQGMTDLFTEQGMLGQPSTPVATPNVTPDVTRALPRNRPNPTGDWQSATANPGEQAAFIGRGVAANVLNTAQGIPGMEAFEAAMGSLGSKFTDNPLNYRQSLEALRGETARIPGPLRMAEKVLGAGPLASMLPGRTVAQVAGSSAGLGAADAGLRADPNLTLGDRALGATVGGIVGGSAGGLLAGGARAVGKARDLGTLANRVRKSPTLGKTALDEGDEIALESAKNYGAVKLEGQAAGRTPPVVKNALDDETIAPFVAKVKASRRFRNADDATVAQEAYKQMSRRQKSIQSTIERNADVYEPALEIEMGDLRDAKRLLKTALSEPSVKPAVPPVMSAERETVTGPIPSGTAGRARGNASQVSVDASGRATAVSPRDVQGPAGPSFMLRGSPPQVLTPGKPAETVPPMLPSLAKAIDTRAEQGHLKDVGDRASDAARRVMNQPSLRGRKQSQMSDEAFMREIAQMSPEEAKAALVKVLGRGKESWQGIPAAQWAGGASIPGFLAGGVPGAVGSAALGAGARAGVRLNRLSPFVEALDKAAGSPMKQPFDLEKLLRALGIANAPLANR